MIMTLLKAIVVLLSRSRPGPLRSRTRRSARSRRPRPLRRGRTAGRCPRRILSSSTPSSRRPRLAGRSSRVSEVAKDLFGDLEAMLQLDQGVARGREQDDVVRPFAIAVDRVGQPAAAPRGDLEDLAASGGDLTGRAVDDRLAPVVRHVRTDHEHEFVSAHARINSFQWGCPVDVGWAGSARSGKETGGSLARAGPDPRPVDVSSRPSRPAQVNPFQSPGGPVPASTILVLVHQPPSPANRSARSSPARATRSPTPVTARMPSRASSSTSWRSSTSGAARSAASPRSSCAARSARRRRWPRCRSCASPTATTSRSASASWRPAPTTSSPGRSTPASSRPGSRRCCCASSARRTCPRSSRATA